VTYPLLKRLFDFVLSLLGLVLLFPLGVVVASIIKLSDRGPVLYAQTRIGQFGGPFRIWKFRTMVVNADKLGLQVTRDQDPRITPIGRFLRKTKLDELPQLWNVFVGDMTFVGPRPEVPKYVALYNPDQREILQLKPGITDLASIMFRDEEELLRQAPNVEEFYISYCIPKKIELNRAYAAKASLVQDLGIILRTLSAVLLGAPKSQSRPSAQNGLDPNPNRNPNPNPGLQAGTARCAVQSSDRDNPTTPKVK